MHRRVITMPKSNICTMKSAAIISFLLLPTNAFHLPSPQRTTTALHSHEISRRSAVQSAAALSTFLISGEAFAQSNFIENPQRILLTGSNSGIGLDAAERMALRGHEVILACVSMMHVFNGSLLLLLGCTF